MWIKNIENKQFGMFENVTSLGEKPGITFVQEITKFFLLLKDEIKHYFFNDGDAQACTCIRNPFTAKTEDLLEGIGEQEKVIDLQCNEGVLEKFKNFTLDNFWLNVSSSYPTPAKNVITPLLIFSTTWKCEQRVLLFLQPSRKLENVW